MIKAQVKTGGRGKAGGVKLADTPDEAQEKAGKILGMDIKGHTVHSVLVAEDTDIAQEYYLSFLLDRAERTFLSMCSVEGGVEIEEVAQDESASAGQDPGRPADRRRPRQGAGDRAGRAACPRRRRQARPQLAERLWAVFTDEDATLVEVNPLVYTGDGRVVALDAKVTLDDNAAFRQDWDRFADPTAVDPIEARAKAKHLNYVKLDGSVGHYRERRRLGHVHARRGRLRRRGIRRRPARQLPGHRRRRLGRGDGQRPGHRAVRPDVRSVLVNVFGGITSCDAVANGIVSAMALLAERGEPVAAPDRGAAGRQQRGRGPPDPRRRRACRSSSRWPPWTMRRGAPPSWPPRPRTEHDMAIFLNADSRIIVQGITGSEGRKHGARMIAAGTNVVGGTNPRKAGQTVELSGQEVPVFGTVAEAMAATGADVSVVFVPPAGTKDAVIEAIDAQIPLVIVITEGVPVHDTAAFWAHASATGNRTRIVGPNCPGVASPGKSNAGIIPADITAEGRIGLVSKSGTLTYQMMYELRDIGFSTAVGIGGDPIIGTTHIDCLRAFQDDPETDAIVMIGEIGGDAEERAAAFIEKNVTKPVVAYVAGFTAPEGKTMGHAGAIISGSAGTAQAKKEALEKVGVRVGRTPSETARLVREIMQAG